eukprot:1135229-Pyramimonas_sp.AAC.1
MKPCPRARGMRDCRARIARGSSTNSRRLPRLTAYRRCPVGLLYLLRGLGKLGGREAHLDRKSRLSQSRRVSR